MRFKNLVNYFFTLFVLLVSAFPSFGNETQEQHLKVIARMIGDEFLLQLGDSTSRILPIEQKDGKYLIKFEKEFGFEPYILTFSASKVIAETKTIKRFILETTTCSNNEVVHSFEVSSKKDDNLLPCKERALPKDCYQVYLTVLEHNFIPIIEPQNLATTSYNFIYPIIIALLLLAFIGFWFKKKKPSINIQDGVDVGAFKFDSIGMKLYFEDSVEELSSKETDLLDLLVSNVNETVKREDILQKVWNDDGDYLGRTLDVFISKLRKKLEADPHVKIINIRGIGYRLVLNN